MKPEKLDADNAYDCGVCLRKAPATKRLTVHSTSQVLVLVLKRFTPVSGAKRAQEVRYPQCLDLQFYTSERKAGPLGYVLCAVLVHSGWSCERGHYFCYVRAGNGQWYKMDDAKVTACDETTALSQSAYVLFYALEGAWEGGDGGGAAAPIRADPTDPQQPAGDASGRAPGSEESPGDTGRRDELRSVEMPARTQPTKAGRGALEGPVSPACRRSRDSPVQTRRREKPHATPTGRPSQNGHPASGAEERRQRPLCQREGQSDKGEEKEAAAISGAVAVGQL